VELDPGVTSELVEAVGLAYAIWQVVRGWFPKAPVAVMEHLAGRTMVG